MYRACDVLFSCAGETDVYLTNGTGGPLKVDDDSSRLEKGVFQISRIVDEQVKQ